MSTELINRHREGYHLTGFYGGDARGYCLQITSDHGYVQVTREGAARLAADIFRHFLETPGPNDVLDDALSNLEHDNYELSYQGYKDRQADIALIRAALAARPDASAEPREVDMDEYRAMLAAMEQIDPATLPGLTAAQHCALGRFAKPADRPAGEGLEYYKT